MPICTACGVIGVTQDERCPQCSTDYPTPVTKVDRDPKHAWVAVRCSFQCRTCHFLSPLDEYDVDGSVECAQCGQAQRFDVGAWREALAHAHAVADLAFPQPQGRYLHPDVWIASPFLPVGHTTCFVEHRQSGTAELDGVTIQRSLFIEAGPGQPVCHTCSKVLDVRVDPGGTTVTSCTGCGTQAEYALPPDGQRWSEALTGIVGEAHRTDQQRARIETSAAGPVALKCPECAGALPATRERVLTCSYCGTASLIPAQARTRDAGQVLRPDVWWIAFRGPSAKRAQLERGEAVLDASSHGASTAGEGDGKGKKIDVSRMLGPPRPDTRLELGELQSRRYPLQIALDLGIPTAALLIAVIIAVLAASM